MFRNLPVGMTYRVTEDNAGDYRTEAEGNAGTITKDGCTASFVNTRDGIVPTGVDLNTKAYAGIFLLAIAGLLFFTRKKIFSFFS